MKSRMARLLSLLLAIVMVVGLLPAMSLAAGSADHTVMAELDNVITKAASVTRGSWNNRELMFGAGAITAVDESIVYFGRYPQSNAGATAPSTGTEGVDWIKCDAAAKNGQGPYYYRDPVKWRVLDDTAGKLLLLSDQNIDTARYHEDSGENITWERSTIRSWLNGYDATNHDGSSDTDYSQSGKSFMSFAFSQAEQGVIADTTVINATADGDTINPNPDYSTPGGNNTTDKLFLLSATQANRTRYFADANSRISTNTAFVYGGGQGGKSYVQPTNSGDLWWLRTPGLRNTDAMCVLGNGTINSMGSNVPNCNPLRPALNLDPNKVLFISPAVDGKYSGLVGGDALKAVGAYTGKDWKLTLEDSSRSAFRAYLWGDGDRFSAFKYENAKTGSNEYISAIIVDKNGYITYYGREELVEPSGSGSLIIYKKMSYGDKMYVFNEQYNGDYQTDYASPLQLVYEKKVPSSGTVVLGAGQIIGKQATSVYFGRYPQSNAGRTAPSAGVEGMDWILSTNATKNNQGPYYYRDPVKWRVLDDTDGKLLLLSDRNLDAQYYHEDDETATWEKSTIRSWLNGYGASSHNGSSNTDYSQSGKNFIGSAFSGKEQAAILTTAVINATADGSTGRPNPSYYTSGGNNTTDKLFLLSITQAENTDYFTNYGSLVSTNTAFVYGGGSQINANDINPVGAADVWWLRSPGGSAYKAAYITSEGGRSYDGGYVNYSNVVRPAFNLDLNAVLLTSPAENGKQSGAVGAGALTAVTAVENPKEWKLTLKDSSRIFAVTQTTVTAEQGKAVTLNYTGAATGANEYISAMIVNSDDQVLYYGRVARPTGANGAVTVTIPAALDAGSYTLKLFSEQYNGDKLTDYASAFADVALTVTAAPPTQYPITVTGGKATVDGVHATQAAAGTIVTLTAYTPASGKDFDKWEILSGDITFTPNEWQPEVSFVMPESAVSVKSVYVEEITSVDITVTAPVAGQSAIFDFSVPSDENYNKCDRSGDNSGQYCCWAVFDTEPSATYYSDADWKLNDESLVFEAGKYYAFRGYLRSNDGYYFRYDSSATVNNQKADYSVLSAMNADVYFLFYCTESAPETVTLTFNTNGGTAVAPVTKTAGSAIDLSGYTTTKEGFLFDGWFSDAALQNKVTSVNLTANTTVYAGWKKTIVNPFTDVKESDYFYQPVLWAVGEGVTNGMTPTTFEPNATCTRAQAVTFLWRANGSPEPGNSNNPFTDVKAGGYYYKAVLWAVEKGITNGTSATTFSPNDTCTRGQIVTFQWRGAGQPTPGSSINPFTDVKSGDYYYNAVLWAVEKGVTNGTSATTFSPNDFCTRGQIVTFLYRQLAS